MRNGERRTMDFLDAECVLVHPVLQDQLLQVEKGLLVDRLGCVRIKVSAFPESEHLLDFRNKLTNKLLRENRNDNEKSKTDKKNTNNQNDCTY